MPSFLKSVGHAHFHISKRHGLILRDEFRVGEEVMIATFALLAAGSMVIAVSLLRARKLAYFSALLSRFEESFDLSQIDTSGRTEYTRCFSHRWLFDKIPMKDSHRLVELIRDKVNESPLLGFLLVAIFLFSSSLILILISLGAVSVLGISLPILTAGVIVSLGPGTLNTSKSLLQAIYAQWPTTLVEEDYVYAKIAHETMRNWQIISYSIGGAFLLLAPFGESIGIVVAYLVAQVTLFALWNPALYLLEYWAVFSVLYLVGAVAFITLSVTRLSRFLVTLWNRRCMTLRTQKGLKASEKGSEKKECTRQAEQEH